MYDDNDEATKFDPSPWGSRQRVIPRRTFKAVASVVAKAPVAPPPIPQSLAARVAESAVAELPMFGAPVVNEADIPTWRVPKLELTLYPTMPRKRLDLRMWLPIGGLASIVIIALLGAHLAGGDMRSDATSISAALLGETSDNGFHIVTNVEQPPAPPALEAPAPRHPIAIAKAKHASVRVTASKRPLLAVDVRTPLGDLAPKRRR